MLKKITVLMAVYNPNVDWFKELLESLIGQDFKDVEWLIMDDASDKMSISELSDLIEHCFSLYGAKVSYKVVRGDNNIGSNEVYRTLMGLAEGDYIAFCDQDDIWEKNKLSRLYEEISKRNGILAYADMLVIDSMGAQIQESFQRANDIFGRISGKGKTSNLFIRNCAPGCNILVRKDALIQYNSIPKGTYWDHWLMILASTQGEIVYIPEKLMRYRIHGTNQTGRFFDVFDKKSYFEKRIKPLYNRMVEMKKRDIHFINEEKIYEFIKARYSENLFLIWKYRAFGKVDAYFEILLILLPDCIIKKGFKWIKK